MPINSSARRNAHRWFLDPEQPSTTDVSVCPKQLSEQAKEQTLAIGKPEFYGKSAHFIVEQLLAYSFTQREDRGDIGFVTHSGEILPATEIASFDALERAYHTTLRHDLNAVIRDIRTMHSAETFDFEQFAAFLSLDGLFTYRSGLNGMPFGDLFSVIDSGLRTATSHAVLLLEHMTDLQPQPEYKTLARSYKPLLRLAGIDTHQLEVFDTWHLVNVSDTPLFATTKRGTIDFHPAVIAELSNEPVLHGPTIGCPVLFGKDCTKNLWQWGVDAAEACGLLRLEPSQ